jgi:hypothetical protein
MRTDGRVQPLVTFNEHADVRAAFQEEGQFLSHLIADGIAGLSIVGQDRNPHDGPSLENAVVKRNAECLESSKGKLMLAVRRQAGNGQQFRNIQLKPSITVDPLSF